MKIYVQNNKVRVSRKVLVDTEAKGETLLYKSACTDDEGYYFDEVVNDTAFDLEVVASTGKLEVKLNGVSKVYQDASLQAWPFENYFKAGNYLQTIDSGSFAEVRYYSLTVKH